MTEGEKMIWAAAYISALDHGKRPFRAACAATGRVLEMRAIVPSDLTADTAEMLQEMLEDK